MGHNNVRISIGDSSSLNLNRQAVGGSVTKVFYLGSISERSYAVNLSSFTNLTDNFLISLKGPKDHTES